MTSSRLAVFTVICIFYVLSPPGKFETFSFAGLSDGTVVDESRAEDPQVKEGSNALSHYMMGMLYDDFGDTASAVAEYEKALAYGGNISEICLKLGTDFLLLGDLEKADEMLKKVVELEPDNTKPYMLLAIIDTAKGDFQKAQNWYEKALEQDPENLKILTFLSDLFVIQKKLDKAAEVYEKILLIKKDDPFIYFNLGIIYSKLNRMDKAEASLRKALEVDPNYLEAQMVLGFIYEIEGNLADAIGQYKRVTEIDSLNKEAYTRLSLLYYRFGESDEAIKQNRILMRLDMYSPEPYLRNFNIYVSEKKYGDAERVLKEALRNGISDAVIYASLGYQASLEKDYGKAADYYTVASEKAPKNEPYKFYLAAALDRSGKREAATELLEGIVAGGSDLQEAYNYLGYILVEEDRELDRAIEMIKRALELDPGNAAYLDSLGWAYYKKGEFEKALEQLTEAVRLLPRDAEIREHLGDVYFDMGALDEAGRHWRMALKLDPANERVKEKLKKLKKR